MGAIPAVVSAAEKVSRAQLPEFWMAHDNAGTAGDRLAVWGVWIDPISGSVDHEVGRNFDSMHHVPTHLPEMPDDFSIMVTRAPDGSLQVRGSEFDSGESECIKLRKVHPGNILRRKNIPGWTLNVGVSKKLGLPAYSSTEATCNLEVELDNGLILDPTGFRDRARGAFLAAEQAVEDELARLQAHGEPGETRQATPTNGRRNGVHTGDGLPAVRLEARPARIGKPAAPSQVRAIVSSAPPPAGRPRRPSLRPRRHPPRGTHARRRLRAHRPAQGRRHGLRSCVPTILLSEDPYSTPEEKYHARTDRHREVPRM